MRAGNESSLVRACLDFLKLRRIFCWRANCSGMFRQDRKGRPFWAPPAMVGVADILACLPPDGKLLAIECKAGTNGLTTAQAAFLQSVAAAGGLAVVAYDLEDLVQALDAVAGR
jgi:hypothetical protein